MPVPAPVPVRVPAPVPVPTSVPVQVTLGPIFLRQPSLCSLRLRIAEGRAKRAHPERKQKKEKRIGIGGRKQQADQPCRELVDGSSKVEMPRREDVDVG